MNAKTIVFKKPHVDVDPNADDEGHNDKTINNEIHALALLLFRFVNGLTGDAPLLELRRWNQTGRAANGVMSGLPPMMIIFTYNLQNESTHQILGSSKVSRGRRMVSKYL